MSTQTTLHIRQTAAGKGKHAIRLTLRRARPARPRGRGDHRVRAHAAGAGGPALVHGGLPAAGGSRCEAVTVEQIEAWMRARGEELYTKVLAANLDTQAIWFAVREQLADLRVEITTGIAEAAAIPWELMRDPQSDSPIALRVQGVRAGAVEPEPQLRARAAGGRGAHPPALRRVPAGRNRRRRRCARSPTGCCKTWAPTWRASRSPRCGRPPSSSSSGR